MANSRAAACKDNVSGLDMTNEDDPKKREAVLNEPFEVWWPKYLDQVKESTEAAERHLEVPTGTISSIPDEPDFIATVKTYAVIEPILNDLIAKGPPQAPYGGTLRLMSLGQSVNENFRTFVTRLNISGRTGKLRLAEGLGLLSNYHIEFIEAVTSVRNRYAHNVKNMHKSLTEILTELQPNHGQIVAHLTGIKKTLPLPSDVDNNFLKLLMYHRLADYLADALHTLRPPPLPEGGILGGLFATDNADTASVAGRADPDK
jgi:hypothetical protein